MVKNDFKESMLSTAEVSKWLGIAPRTIRFWAECLELPGIKLGRQWRFQRAALIAWLEERDPAFSPSSSRNRP
jgi:excisionase family DNA binding protein